MKKFVDLYDDSLPDVLRGLYRSIALDTGDVQCDMVCITKNNSVVAEAYRLRDDIVVFLISDEDEDDAIVEWVIHNCEIDWMINDLMNKVD